jgi:hypothetical protein
MRDERQVSLWMNSFLKKVVKVRPQTLTDSRSSLKLISDMERRLLSAQDVEKSQRLERQQMERLERAKGNGQKASWQLKLLKTAFLNAPRNATGAAITPSGTPGTP